MGGCVNLFLRAKGGVRAVLRAGVVPGKAVPARRVGGNFFDGDRTVPVLRADDIGPFARRKRFPQPWAGNVGRKSGGKSQPRISGDIEHFTREMLCKDLLQILAAK